MRKYSFNALEIKILPSPQNINFRRKNGIHFNGKIKKIIHGCESQN